MSPSRLPCCLVLLTLLGSSGCGSYEVVSETVRRITRGGTSVDQAKDLFRKGDLIDAERALRERLKFDPENTEARLTLADIYTTLAHQSGLFLGTEPPASIEQLNFVARKKPKNLRVAERLMYAHLEARRMTDARTWAVIVARLDKQHPVAHQLITDALADQEKWDLMLPLTTKLSRIPTVPPLVIVNAAVRLGRGQKNLWKYEEHVMRYLALTSSQTHLQWAELAEEDIPRLMSILEAAVELGLDVSAREDRLSQTLTIVSRLIKTVRPEVVPWILDREADIVLNADSLNQGDLMAERLPDSIEARLLSNRRRIVEMAMGLPEDMTLDRKTLGKVRTLQRRLTGGTPHTLEMN